MLTPEVIAEAGSNHNGSIEAAKKLIDIAEFAGASSVKFQFIYADGLYLPKYLDDNSYVDNPVFKVRQSEEITESQWRSIWAHAKTRGIDISASVFCKKGISLLKSLGASYVKIASTDLTNHWLIGQACAAFDRVIVSTGMANFAEVAAMVNFVRSNFPKTNLQIMHCISLYPCPLESANLTRIKALKEYFDIPVGYSDHTGDNISAPMALVSGASFFEKHFTYDQSLPGFDHAHALDADGLKEYISTLNNSSAALSSKRYENSEKECVSKIRARRGVYAARDLKAGDVLKEEDLLFVRPSTEYNANDPTVFVGSVLNADIPQYTALGEGGGVKKVKSNWKEADQYWSTEMKEKGMEVSD